MQKGLAMKNIILSAYMFITFSLGSLPDGVSNPNDVGGLFVIGLYDEKPVIKSRATQHGILITLFEY